MYETRDLQQWGIKAVGKTGNVCVFVALRRRNKQYALTAVAKSEILQSEQTKGTELVGSAKIVRLIP